MDFTDFPVTRGTALLAAVIGVLMGVFGFYSYCSAARYDVVTLEGTLGTAGENLINAENETSNFEFYIKEKPLRFRIDNISYKCFDRAAFKSTDAVGKKVVFDADRDSLEKPFRPAHDNVATVYVYSFGDESRTYLSFDEAKSCRQGNKKSGLYLGIGGFLITAILLLLRKNLDE